MSAISQIASKFLGGGSRKGGTTAGRPAGGSAGGVAGSGTRGTTGGSGSDAAVGKAVKGVFSKLRR